MLRTPSLVAVATRVALASLLALAACSSSSSNNSADAGDDADSGYDDEGGEDVTVIGPLDAFALDDAGATSTCKALTSYAKCNTSDPCAALEAKDCILLDGLYNLAGRKAFTSCYGAASACEADASTGINGCLFAAAALETPDKTQTKLATDFCAACKTGDSNCASDFYSDITTDAGVVGLGAVLNLTLSSDSVIEAIDSACIPALSGVADCGDHFAECAETQIDPAQCNPMSGGGDAGADGGTDPGGA